MYNILRTIMRGYDGVIFYDIRYDIQYNIELYFSCVSSCSLCLMIIVTLLFNKTYDYDVGNFF